MSFESRPVLFVAAALLFAACSRPGWLRVPEVDMPAVDLPSFGGGASDARPASDAVVEVMTDAPEVQFHSQASQFYGRITGRRFNSLASFRDERLREYFESPETYADYFSDLAQDLAEAHFERNEPVRTEVEEFLVEGPGRARVRVKVLGENGLPLRFWGTSFVREDRWERRSGRWWIVPSAL